MTPNPNALFLPDESSPGVFVPTPQTEGPWDPNAMHGGPPAGLLARTVERFDAADGTTPVDWFVSRLTIELLRPIPIRALRVTARLLRPGRRVQLVEASIADVDSGTEQARVTALRIRRQPGFAADVPRTANDTYDATRRPLGIDDPAAVPAAPSFSDATRGFYNIGADVRLAAGKMTSGGPGTIWASLHQPLVLGEVDSPLVTTATLADFTNASATALPAGGFAYPNADLTIARYRDLRGTWLGIDGVSRVSDDGIGMTTARLFDVDGPIGQTTASLVVSDLRGS